jgi:hypothetical protein
MDMEENFCAFGGDAGRPRQMAKKNIPIFAAAIPVIQAKMARDAAIHAPWRLCFCRQ